VKTGTTVALVTSSGFCEVIVPNVVGTSQANATASSPVRASRPPSRSTRRRTAPACPIR
jgi:hypothetical protein